MRLFYSLILLWGMAALPAQGTYFARLADEVCNCMERVSVEPANKQATNCLREVALANEESLRKRYNLVASEATQRDLLADRLAGDLLENCPLLTTLNYEIEQELRWSDRDQPEVREPIRYQGTKGPPADPAASISGEPPTKWLVGGTVRSVSGGKLLLELPKGATMALELPSGMFRLRKIKVGDALKLSFRREWRKQEERIVNVVIGLEG